MCCFFQLFMAPRYHSSLARPIPGSRLISACPQLHVVQLHASPSPVAEKVPLDSSWNICPAAVLGGRAFLLPSFQFSLRW